MLTHEEPLWPDGSIRLYNDGHLDLVGADGAVRRLVVAKLEGAEFGRRKHGRVPLTLRFKRTIGTRGVTVQIDEATLPAVQGLAAAALSDRDAAVARG